MGIDLTGIRKSFKDDLVLDGISLSVATGETLVLFGPRARARPFCCA